MFDNMLSTTICGDVDGVRRVIAQDDEVDVIYEQVTRECTARMNDPKLANGSQILGTFKLARRLEIIGDSVVNACRWWLYFTLDREEAVKIVV